MTDDDESALDRELDERADQDSVMPDPDAPDHKPDLPPEDQIEE